MERTWRLLVVTVAFGCVVYMVLYERKVINDSFTAVSSKYAYLFPFDHSQGNAPRHNVQAKNESTIWIHSWTRVSQKYPAWPMFSDGALNNCELPKGMRCEYTADKRYYNKSHAILIKPRQVKEVTDLPPYRLPHQKWILFNGEPPTKTWSYVPYLNTSVIRPLFNLTSTYTLDSNIPKHFPLSCVRNQEAYGKLASKDFASGKTKNVMWFVSHCNTSSQRELYVEELKKYIDVDIYGDCGDLKCGQPGYKKARSKDNCDKRTASKQYRFYLSFENSLCDMYVTEKLTDILNRKMILIPIVMGYANYTKMIPPDSFIDVRDFHSPQQLAKYLHKVSKDYDLFNRYIRSKNSMECRRTSQSYPCRLCEYLHMHKNEEQIINDVVDFWHPEKRCLTPGEHWHKP